MNTEKNLVCQPDAKKMEALMRLSGKTAHDLNNILGAIEGYATLAASAMKTDDPAKADMGEIQQAVAKAAGLMKQFLVFSGRYGVGKTSCDISGLLAGLTGKTSGDVWKGVKLELDVQPGLPVISADASGVEQALLKLLDNAREAMPGGGAITVRAVSVSLPPAAVKARKPPESACEFIKISVTDSGPGIPEEVRERLFEPFFTTKKNQPGAGLGLPAVYGIAARHNGWVEFNSEPGRGGEFIVFLPV
jgi:two-component system cell cycle sensor histidine kinase/response regulator CckA